MRLITLTLFILGVLLLFILLVPATFLHATATVIPDSLQQTSGGVLAGFSTAIGRPATAADVYDFLISRHPDSGDIYRLKSEAQLSAGDETGALKSLDAALARDSQNVAMLEKKARLLIRAGKMNDAEAIFSTILSLKTDNPEYLSAIADLALEKNQYVNALDRYTSLLAIRPADGLTWEKRSDVIFALLTIPTASVNAPESLIKKDLYSEGITGYEKALKLNPGRTLTIQDKISKRSEEYTPRSIRELEERYSQYRYLKPGEKPLPG